MANIAHIVVVAQFIEFQRIIKLYSKQLLGTVKTSRTVMNIMQCLQSAVTSMLSITSVKKCSKVSYIP